MNVSGGPTKDGLLALGHREKFPSVSRNRWSCLDDIWSCINSAGCDMSLDKLGLKVFFRPALEFSPHSPKSPIM